MASNLKRSKRTVGKRIDDLHRRVLHMQKRPAPRRIGSRVVVSSNLVQDAITPVELAPDSVTQDAIAPGAVTDTELASGAGGADTTFSGTAPTSPEIGDVWFDSGDSLKLKRWSGSAWVSMRDLGIAAAQAGADAAAAGAAAAQTTADGKNKVYRQTAAPTGGTYAEGDLWFDTDDDNKIYRRTSSVWTAVTLGGEALANINANKITAGTIDASVITVSNINAGNISAGTIAAARITTASISAANIDASQINAGFINSERINTSSISAADINADRLTAGTITGLLVRTAASGGRAELNAGGIQLYNASDANVYSFSQNPTYGGSALFTSWASIGPNNQANSNWLYDNVSISGAVGAATDIECPGRLFIGGSQAQHTPGYGLSIEKYSGYATYPGMSIGPISHYGAADYSFLIHDTAGITLINARDDSATNPYHGVQIRLGNVPHTTFSPYWLTTNNRGIDSGANLTKAGQYAAPNIFSSYGSFVYNAQWYWDYIEGIYRLGYASSNRDAKQDIADMPDMLPLIAKLRPRTFRWKNNENAEVHDPTANYLRKSAELPDNMVTVATYSDGEYERGFIVEEVEECGHDLVNWHPESDEPKPMMWKTNDFIAIAIKGIQELKSQIDDLSTKVKELESNQ